MLLTIIFFGYLKNILNINLFKIFEDQPGGAVFDLVIISSLKSHAKKIAYILNVENKDLIKSKKEMKRLFNL